MGEGGLSELEQDLTDEQRHAVLARWERDGRLECRTWLLDWELLPDGSSGKRLKERQYIVRGEILVRHDGRQPYPTREQFAAICLAVMACA